MIVDLSDKVAIVTGAGQGIGEGIARVFAKAGAKIVIATRSRANGQSVADSIVKSGGAGRANQTYRGAPAQGKSGGGESAGAPPRSSIPRGACGACAAIAA